MNQSAATAVNPKPVTVSVCGHFGEFLQGRAADGEVALVTVHCPAFVTRLTFTPEPGGVLSGDEPSQKALRAAELALSHLDRAALGGRLDVSRPIPAGHGAGSSTAETLAALRAVCASLGATMSPEVEAALCLAAEGAIDPLMYGQGPLLFASRRGRIIEKLPPLPSMQIVGGFAGPARPTEAEEDDFPDISTEIVRLKAALETGSLADLGAAATASAHANQRRNPNPIWDAILDLAEESGAAGLVVAHTGTAIGLMVEEGRDTRPLEERFRALGAKQVLSFRPG